MWRRRNRRDTDVTCIGCGETVPRESAREYDKLGDRWNRDGKEFEHLCKPCYRELCHQPRDGLEALLVGLNTGGMSREEFLAAYCAAVDAEFGSAERERER